MPFSNPIVGGQETLVRSAIKSPNFAVGSAGWIIRRDGSVEFNNGVFRGTITAGVFAGTNFTINSSGLFFYSGTPAFGNLILALAPSSGTDAFGNAYAQGLSLTSPAAIRLLTGMVFDSGGLRFYSGTPASGNLLLALSPASGTDGFSNDYPRGLQVKNPARVEFPGDITRESDPGNLASGTGGVVPADYTFMFVSGPKSNGVSANDQVTMALFSANHDNTSTANAQLGWVSNAGTAYYGAYFDRSGFNVRFGRGIALDPTTGGGLGPTPISEVWHSLGSPSATGYTNVRGRYKRAFENNMVIIDILLVATAGATRGAYAYANTMPGGYCPQDDRAEPIGAHGTWVSAGERFPMLRVNTTGVVTVHLPTMAVAGNVVGGTVFVPID